MDLVALEAGETGPRIVFWEVKTLDDKRLRKEDDQTAKVITQLRKYRDFLSCPKRAGEVLNAYEETRRLLSWLRRLAGHEDPSPSDIATDLSRLSLDPTPRVVCFEGSTPTPAGWEAHKTKILAEGFPVRSFGPARAVRLS